MAIGTQKELSIALPEPPAFSVLGLNIMSVQPPQVLLHLVFHLSLVYLVVFYFLVHSSVLYYQLYLLFLEYN